MIKKFFLKRPRFWGDLCIAAAVLGFNIGSAWAGIEYGVIHATGPWANSAPANVGFQRLCLTAYPAAIVLLVLGLRLRSKYKRP